MIRAEDIRDRRNQQEGENTCLDNLRYYLKWFFFMAVCMYVFIWVLKHFFDQVLYHGMPFFREEVMDILFYMVVSLGLLTATLYMYKCIRGIPWKKFYKRCRHYFGRKVSDDSYDRRFPRRARHVLQEQPHETARLQADDEMPISIPLRLTRPTIRHSRSSNIVPGERLVVDIHPPPQLSTQAESEIGFAASRSRERQSIWTVPNVGQDVIQGQDVRRTLRSSTRSPQGALFSGQTSYEGGQQATGSDESRSRRIAPDREAKTDKVKKKIY